MVLIILLIVIGAWSAYVVVWLRDGRSTSASRGNEIESFRRSLRSLGGSTRAARVHGEMLGSTNRTPGVLAPPITSAQAARRRSQVVLALIVTALGSLMIGSVIGWPGLIVHVLADIGLLGFIYASLRRRRLISEQKLSEQDLSEQDLSEQKTKVRVLHPHRPVPLAAGEAALIELRRTAAGV